MSSLDRINMLQERFLIKHIARCCMIRLYSTVLIETKISKRKNKSKKLIGIIINSLLIFCQDTKWLQIRTNAYFPESTFGLKNGATFPVTHISKYKHI